jgi:hypothetical protein
MFQDLAKLYTLDYKKNKKTIDELDIIFKKDKRIFKYEMKNNKISFSHHSGLAEFYIQRGKALQLLFQKTIDKYPMNFNIPFYVYIGDELPRHYQSYPIFTFAKKSKEPGILIPDWTFIDPYTSTLSK